MTEKLTVTGNYETGMIVAVHDDSQPRALQSLFLNERLARALYEQMHSIGCRTDGGYERKVASVG